MSTIAISSIDLENFRYTGSSLTLRVYLNEAFVSAAGIPQQADSPDGQNFWYESAACTLNGTTLTVAAITLESTTDGLDRVSSTYSAFFFSGSTMLCPYEGFERFRLSQFTALTTWANVRQFNAIKATTPDYTTYTAQEIDRRFSLIAGGAPDDAAYWVSEANSDLDNEVNLGLLNTGLLKVSVSGLAATPMNATAEVDYVTPSGVGTLSNKTLSAPIINAGSDAIGDVYYRNAGGMFTRLPIGTSAQVLTVTGGLPVWSTPASGFADPMTTIGDVIIRDGTNTTARLGIGTSNQVLTVSGGVPIWATPASGFSDPMTTRGDIIVRNSSNTTARLAVGAANRYLGSDGTDIAYSQVSLTAGVTGTLPIANGGTGSATRIFVQTTGDESVAGVKTLTGVPIFISNVASDGAQGSTTTANLWKGADSSSGSPIITGASATGTPSTFAQTFRQGGTNGFPTFGFLWNFNLINASATDAYVNYTLARLSPSLSGAPSGSYSYEINRNYGILSPTNVTGGTHNLHMYVGTFQAERTVSGVAVAAGYFEVRNSTSSDANVSTTSIDRLYNIVTSSSFTSPSTGAHGTGIIFSEGINAANSAYFGWRLAANSVCQRGLDFTDMSATLSGTWTASAATTIAGSGGHADVECIAGDIISVNGTLCTVASAVANTITLTATFAGTPASGLTITKKVQPIWFANNSYLWWNNAATSAKYRLGGLGTDDRFAFDPDNRGVVFGGGKTLISTTSGFPGIWFDTTATAAPTLSNYSFLYDQSVGTTILNGALVVDFRIANASAWTINASGNFVGASGKTLSIGGGTALATTNQTGTGSLVLATSPTLVTPTLGVAAATSLTAANLYGGSLAGATLTLAGTSNGSPSSAHVNINPLVSATTPGITFIGASSSSPTVAGVNTVLHLQGTETQITALAMDSYMGINATGSALVFRTARNTAASPQASAAGDSIAIFGGRPYNATGTAGFTAGNRAAITFRTLEAITDVNQGMYLSFEGTPKGSTTRRQIEYIGLDTTLTDNTATSLFEIALATGGVCGGTIEYDIVVTNASDQQSFSGTVCYSAANKSGTYSKAITNPDGTAASTAKGASSLTGASTLTVAWSILEGTNKVTIQLTADTSLSSPTSFKVYYRLINNSLAAITLL